MTTNTCHAMSLDLDLPPLHALRPLKLPLPCALPPLTLHSPLAPTPNTGWPSTTKTKESGDNNE
jgi:hypothetical protein